MHKVKRIFITALLSSIIFVTNFFVPPPISYLLIAVQAVILALATLFVGKAGATYVGLVGGVLSGLSRPAFGPFTFVFTFLYGVLVDLFFAVFKASPKEGVVKRNRVILAMACSTAIIGFVSYYTVAVYSKIIEVTPTELTPMMSILVIFVGTGSGIAAGYAAAYLWNKYLKSIPL
ncbi:MAG: hypothetical protein NWF05_01355 [Candidatus Bathyarchaeota archaeon]|nr:hypothetical protein [Candidatus Bathyarchaeota archaeon]